jgi:hypothetical protein
MKYTRCFCLILTKFDTFLKDFRESFPISKFSKIPLVADTLIHTDRRTDRQDEGNRAFREYMNAPER